MRSAITFLNIQLSNSRESYTESVLFGGKPVIYRENDMHGLNLQYMIRKNKRQGSLFMEI